MTIPRASSPNGSGRTRRPRPDRAELARGRQGAEGGEEAADHRRRRRALFAGVGRAREIRRARRAFRSARRRAANPRCRDDHRAQHGGRRRHRHVGRQPARRRGRRGPCRRHAPAGFHHRLLGAVQERRQDDHRAQRAGFRRRQAPRAAAGRRCAAKALQSSPPRSAGYQAPASWTANAKDGKAEWQAAAAKVDRLDQCRAALRCAGDRRGAARDGLGRHRCCMRPAGCPASCTSSGRPARPAPTMPNTASPAWATRSPAGSASRWRSPTRKSSSWSATAPI